MSEVKKCPKCGNEMADMRSLSDGHGSILLHYGLLDYRGKVIPFCCQTCGYIELYNEEIIKKV